MIGFNLIVTLIRMLLFTWWRLLKFLFESEGVCHHFEEKCTIFWLLVHNEDLLIIIEVDLESLDIEEFIERFIIFFFGEGSLVETFLLIIINCIGIYVVNDHPYRVVPVTFVTLESYVNVIYFKDSIVYYSYEIFLSKSFIFGRLRPFLFHLHLYSFEHTFKHLFSVYLF